jgi:hypothetical protein
MFCVKYIIKTNVMKDSIHRMEAVYCGIKAKNINNGK